MRAVVQRVSKAEVRAEGRIAGSIAEGLVVYLAAGAGDDHRDVDYLAEKVSGLRVFPDDHRSMNRSLLEVGGRALVVSQFTLYGDCRRGRRPSFVGALEPAAAEVLVEAVARALEDRGVGTARGVFGARMEVESTNQGPVTILLDSGKLF